MTHFLSYFLLTHHKLCVLLLFVLLLSLLPCTAYNNCYFCNEIFHLLSLLFRSLLDLLLCHYMSIHVKTDHYVSDCLINYLVDPDFQTYLYQVEDVKRSFAKISTREMKFVSTREIKYPRKSVRLR